MITDEQLAEWEKLANATEPGPWHLKADSRNCLCVATLDEDDEDGVDYWIAEMVGSIGDDNDGSQHAMFIAEAREAVPALIAEVRRLRAELNIYTPLLASRAMSEFGEVAH